MTRAADRVEGGVVVIGVGNPFRRDDGVGPAAVAMLREALPDIEVVALDGEPTRLLDAWAGRGLAVVVDAVCAGDWAGTIHRIDVGVDPLPEGASPRSTHGAGVADAVALGAAIDRLPERLVVYGIEPADMTDGPGLSTVTQQALPVLVAQVVSEVRSRCA